MQALPRPQCRLDARPVRSSARSAPALDELDPEVLIYTYYIRYITNTML